MIHPAFNGGRMPLDWGYNVAVRAACHNVLPCGYDVTMDESEAPDTLEKLTAHIEKTGRMLVWGGASDNTIFCDEETNWAFRAWHDWWHWRLQAPFTAEGEAEVCKAQQDHLIHIYGDNARSRRFCALLDIEINGQASYLRETGDFPVDQYAFVKAELEKRALLAA